MTKKDKFEIIKNALVSKLREEGVDTLVSNMEQEINEITYGYLLVEQCLWYRVTSDAKVNRLLEGYQDTIAKARELISKHGFENLVRTFRAYYTNLYQVTTSVGRKYHLSKKDYLEFIDRIDKGELGIVIVAKVTKKARVASDMPKSTFSTLIKTNNLPLVNTMAKDIASDVVVKTTKPSKKVVAKATKKGWNSVGMNIPSDKTFVKIKMHDNTNKFVRIISSTNTSLDVNDHGTNTTLATKDIKEIYVYVK